MNQHHRRRAAAGALVAVLCAGAAACGGDSKDKADAKPSASKSVKAPAPLTKARLTAASLTDGEPVGPYTASEPALDGPFSDEYTADPEVCQPLVSLKEASGQYGAPVAEVNRTVDKPDEMLGESVDVQLRTYAEGNAARVMQALTKAGTACAAGFTEERAVAKGKYLKVETLKAPAIGDEAKAFRFTVLDVKGELKLYRYLTVARSGSTTLSFRASILSTKDIGGVPQEIVDAQWKKFQAAKN
ncbi:hypothetical protein [Streptomyces sp. NBC_01465]|uniref:hypothetical protein n=1 Tax=Streptomyces sp. NBC_01465 TaxID=2903878 RepID=UPI002E3156B1|nr:hypothetical protein [Streptomyces sp. NBC_01465]